MTLFKKQFLVRQFMKKMLPYVLTGVYELPDDATYEDAQEMVAERFVPYLNPPVKTRGKKILRVRSEKGKEV